MRDTLHQAVGAAGVVYFLALLAHVEWASLRAPRPGPDRDRSGRCRGTTVGH